MRGKRRTSRTTTTTTTRVPAARATKTRMRKKSDPKGRRAGGARRHQRGVALLLVLWIFMILGVLALDFARYLRDDAMAAINFADETRGYYVALAGMNRAILDAERRVGG